MFTSIAIVSFSVSQSGRNRRLGAILIGKGAKQH